MAPTYSPILSPDPQTNDRAPFIKPITDALPDLRLYIPHKVRRKWRATKNEIRRSGRTSPIRIPTDTKITKLNTSFSPRDTIQSLREHKWSPYDAQYILLLLILIFVFVVNEASMVIKLAATAGMSLALMIPVTRQFFLPTLPIFGWLILFFSCKFIPSHYRPGIWVRVLPTLESIFYGANLSNIISAHKHVILDILAWIPYGLTHFGAPFVISAIMFVYAPPKYLPAFARTFGYMNMAGVFIQLIFPCSPPWYENMYGLAPADYSVKGSPAGLARVDDFLGFDMYTTAFTGSPQVFGAFPSLHSANATLEALFMSNLFPRLTPLFMAYTMWLWWSTMYLSHHYAVDLVGGSLLAAAFFFTTKSHFLPRIQKDRPFRWHYTHVEIGEKTSESDAYAHGGLPFYESAGDMSPGSDDQWTLDSRRASSSSFAEKSPRPSRSSARNSYSAVRYSTGDLPRASLSTATPQQHYHWDGETLASTSDEEHNEKKLP